jgi:hypothetical protein
MVAPFQNSSGSFFVNEQEARAGSPAEDSLPTRAVMKRYIPSLLALAAVLTFAACDSNDFEDGEAQVISRDFTFDPQDAAINGNVMSEQFNFSAITQDVVDFGAVLVYFWDQETWTALPYTYPVGPTDDEFEDTISIGYAFEEGFLEIFYEASVAEVLLDEGPNEDVDMRVVVIRSNGAGKTGIDLRNYEEVVRYYGLEN